MADFPAPAVSYSTAKYTDATLKKFYRDGDQVTLVSLNPNYPPMIYNLKETPVSILGRLVELRAKF